MIIALAPFVIPDARKTVLSFFSCRMFLLAQLSTVRTSQPKVSVIFFLSNLHWQQIENQVHITHF